MLRGDKPIEVLIDEPEAWDVAAFGRMFASDPAHSIEAAIQVAHAVTVKPAAPQADFFSTVEELAAPGETGAAHTGERELSAGTFYGYVCIDGGALGRALGETGAREVVRRLVEAICTCGGPKGMQASFASRVRPHWVRIEKGDAVPYQPATVFHSSVEDPKAALLEAIVFGERMYGPRADDVVVMDGSDPKASMLKDVLAWL